MRKLELAVLAGLVVAVALGLHSADIFATGPSWSTALEAPQIESARRPLIADAAAGLSSTPTPPLTAAAEASPTSNPTAPSEAHRTAIPQRTATPTERSAISSRGGARPTSKEEFIARFVPDAQASQRETGVPASVTLAQAGLESNWGDSQLAQEANNYFGIKATDKPGPAGVIRLPTWENLGGANVTVMDSFRAYHNAEESFVDHGRFFIENSRYARAMQNTNDPRTFARLIQQAGYATDPAYATKLIGLMDRFNLYQYDLPPSGQ